MAEIHELTRLLHIPLPEEIETAKRAGDLAGAAAAIDSRLAGELPELLRGRLTVERERLRRLPEQYPWNRREAQRKLNELLPAVSWAEFDALEAAGRIDSIYLNGEKRYFVRFHRTLAKFPDLLQASGGSWSAASPWLDPVIAEIRERGGAARRITLETSVWAEPDAFVPGTYLAHLPYPIPCAQQSRIELLAGDPDGINPEDTPARSVWWRRDCEREARFTVRYRYVSAVRYADPLRRAAPSEPLYPEERPVTAADLGEEEPWMTFTPLLRALAAEITAGCGRPAEKAWAIYSWITHHVRYSFMREYFLIDRLGEFCAVNGHGDCGLQALLFILLCRISGIPARWQSGLEISEDYVGSHDWAQFWLEGWGWLFADPSYGGGALRDGSESRHDFYFGNIDPLRMAANRAFHRPLTPAKAQLRLDPFDHQSGEIEREGAARPFTWRDADADAELTGLENC